jgi:phage baseplate assembly protein W
MATQNAQPYGITLPITHGPSGYFNQSYSVGEQIKSNLNLLLRTKKGERRMNPDFGSGLWNVLFENNVEEIGQIVESTIRKDISRWMNYVNVESVDVDRTSDSSQHRINVSVVYTVPVVGITNEQVLQVDMNTTNV